MRPLIDVKSRRIKLAGISPANRDKWCRGSMVQARLDRKVIIHGQITNYKSNAQVAGNALFYNIAAYYAGEDHAARIIRNTLEEGAKINAFTELIPYFSSEYKGYNPMNEPVYQAANFMVPLSHSYLILKEEYPEDKVLLSNIRHWGDTLFKITQNGGDSFQGQSKGMDRRALKAAGWASWGNVTNNQEIITSAYHQYVLSLYSIGKGGEDRLWIKKNYKRRIYYANMNFSAALVAAYALYQSGINDVTSIAPGGGTLVEAMVWLWNTIVKDKSYLLRPRSEGSQSVAWIDLFIHQFPDQLSVSMKSWLVKASLPRYGNMNGGPTTCFYRQIL